MIIDAENSADGADNRTNRARPTTAHGSDVADLVHGSAEAERGSDGRTAKVARVWDEKLPRPTCRYLKAR